jgi:spore coat polysaccharide biosynthesis predicted glycosyltransferase SpsG
VKPVIGIGTSGFNPLDMNSYVAVEFEFMYEVLTSFKELKDEGQLFSILIKVRLNGVLDQYKSFVQEYFPDLEIDLLREVPMIDVLEKTDLYISIYSQTLFEASCLGIPVIYYKKDKEYLDAPFDGKSELVTVNTVHGLKQAFIDFKNAHTRFDGFLDRSVMEKYIGPLDGNNTSRNLDYIYGLLDTPKIGALH